MMLPRSLKTVTPGNALIVAKNAAAGAARIIMRQYGKTLQVDEKHRHDFVTEIDRQSEAFIIQTIRRAFPGHEILAEESGTHERPSPYRWIVDPLDGTTNYIHGIPFFAISIALEINGQIAAALVYEPVRQEWFTATADHGAFLNGRRIHVSSVADSAYSVLATGFPFRNYSKVDSYMKLFKFFMLNSSGIRRPGSAALDLCYLACGRFDGFWELNLSPWDVAAGSLIIKEAGGTVTDFRGGTDYIYSGTIVGSNSRIHSWMLDAIRNHYE